MLFKLALRNIRRSIRDYAIYFVTLLVAITVFYAFNSVSDQQVMNDIAASSKMNIKEFTAIMMNIFSIAVSLVLGFLVIYANQLLIRRRKREFGMYFLLGMSAGQVSRIILYETVLVGLASLVLGIGLGILVSQLLSFLTAALYGIALPNYEFSFSLVAFVMTLACFLAIYVVVAIFNVFSIRRRKLIDLINADARSQKVVIRNMWVCLILFFASILILVVAYWQLQENGMNFMADEHFIAATVLMLIGTLLLFFSLAGFIIGIVTRLRGFYLKMLRPFTLRQVASKVNTSFASVWIVCILLFFAITTFATGMAMVDAFVKDIDEANPYDATLISYQAVAEGETDPRAGNLFNVSETEDYLKEHIPSWDEMVQGSAHLDVYRFPDLTYGEVMEATGAEVISSGGYIESVDADFAGVSQFNEVLALQGKDAVTLDDGQYLITNNMAAAEELASEMAKQSFVIRTPIGDLTPQPDVMAVQLGNNSMLSNGVTIIVPDALIDEIAVNAEDTRFYSFLDVTLKSGVDDKAFESAVTDSFVAGVSNLLLRNEMIEQSMGMRMIITYLALYIGLVLLVAVAAVLAVQLLSLTIDSLGRYRALSRLGCDVRMLGLSLLGQVVVYFVLPLLVAVCHSAWAIHVMTRSLFDGFGLDLLPTIFMSAAFVLVIYGGYMLITFFASRVMVREALKA